MCHGKGDQKRLRRNSLFHVVSLFKHDFNEPIYYKVKTNNLLVKYYFYALGILGRIPISCFKNSFRYEVNDRIVTIPFAMQNLHMERGQTVLDFGCNESKFSIELASYGYKVTGVDLANYDFRHRNFSFKKGNFLDNDFENESFAAVVAISSVEHVGLGSYNSSKFPGGDRKVVDEMYRILKNKGVLLITVPFAREYHEDTFERTYDDNALHNLVSMFKITKEEYFIRNRDKAEWLPCTKDQMLQDTTDQQNGVEGVACLVCLKHP